MLLERSGDQCFEEVLDNEFRVLSVEIASMLAHEGKKVRPYLAGLPYFSKLPTVRKQQIVEQLRFYRELCHSQLSEGYKLKDSQSFTWRAFRRLGLVPPSDLFNHISDDDIIEVYSRDQIQLFRNFAFFDFCSYTLEELHACEWWSLFERDIEVTQKILTETHRAFDGVEDAVFVPNVPTHQLREARSPELIAMNCEIRGMAPLYRNKRVEAIIVMEKAEILRN